MQRQLCWVDHIIRMSPNRLPRRLLYSELQEGPWWPDETFFRQRQATAEEMPDTARSDGGTRR